VWQKGALFFVFVCFLFGKNKEIKIKKKKKKSKIGEIPAPPDAEGPAKVKRKELLEWHQGYHSETKERKRE